MRRLLVISGTLAIGSVAAATLYWSFLNTPESNVLMLLVSALLAVALVGIVALTVNTAVLVARGAPTRSAVAGGSRGTGWFLVAVTPLLLAWWAIGRGDEWILSHQGEINAWLMTQFGWADITRLLQVEVWVSLWLRWTLLPVITLSLLAALLTSEVRQSGWWRRAWRWHTLLVTTAVFILLFALPWQLTGWRPQVPPTWIEPLAAGLRLSAVFLLALIGAAVMIVASVRPAPGGGSGPSNRRQHD